jgi:anti-anti-sigma regulatory factor
VIVRAQGVLNRPAAAGPADHLCWVYDDASSLAAVARQFLSDGLARGERLLFVGDYEGIDALRQPATVLPDVDALVAGGVLQLVPVEGAYRTGQFDADRQLKFYDEVTRRAVGDGYTGLRVVADVTPLAMNPARQADLVRWEHLADDFFAHGPGMSAMCAYRRGQVSPAVLAAAAAVHPQVHAPDDVPPFRVWFDDGGLAVAGVLDAFSADHLLRVLLASHVAGPVVRLDLSRVEFVDAAGCRALARWAQALQGRSARLTLGGASRLFRQTWQMLGFDQVTDATFEAAGS